MSTTAKLTSKCQITLPVAVRRALDLRPGDRVQVELKDGAIMLRPLHGSFVDSIVGLGREVWQAEGGAARFIERERDAWGER